MPIRALGSRGSGDPTDVEYAILLGSDAVMLSEETALGKYPLEAVAEMEKIVSRAERAESFAVNLL